MVRIPDVILVEEARRKLSDAIKLDADEARGPFRDVIDATMKPIWSPLPDTLMYGVTSKGFVFTMHSTDNQVNAYWAEGMGTGYVAHNGQQRHIASDSILKGMRSEFHRVR